MSARPADAATPVRDAPSFRMTPDEFEVRRESCTTNPWRIYHTPSQRFVTIPKVLTNADGNEVRFQGPACFPRKRDALAWLRDELPALLPRTKEPAHAAREARCACPSTDAGECVEMRYGITSDEARDEPCECACHESDEDDDEQV